MKINQFAGKAQNSQAQKEGGVVAPLVQVNDPALNMGLIAPQLDREVLGGFTKGQVKTALSDYEDQLLGFEVSQIRGAGVTCNPRITEGREAKIKVEFSRLFMKKATVYFETEDYASTCAYKWQKRFSKMNPTVLITPPSSTGKKPYTITEEKEEKKSCFVLGIDVMSVLGGEEVKTEATEESPEIEGDSLEGFEVLEDVSLPSDDELNSYVKSW